MHSVFEEGNTKLKEQLRQERIAKKGKGNKLV